MEGVGKDNDNGRPRMDERTEVQGKYERGLLVGEIGKGAGEEMAIGLERNVDELSNSPEWASVKEYEDDQDEKEVGEIR